MALRPKYVAVLENVDYFMYTVGERGGVVVGTGVDATTFPLGSSSDNSNRRVTYADNASGYNPVGVLFNDFVNKDLSDTPQNVYKYERQVGDKAHVIVVGTVVTNRIAAGQASGIALPAKAYVGLSGLLYTDAAYNTASGYPVVGRFLTNTDADGYAELYVNALQ